MTIDPKWRFVLGLIITLAIGISSGAVALTHAIPAEFIPAATAWCSIIAFVGSAAQTGISALGMSNTSRLAGVAPLPLTMKVDALADNNPEIKNIITTQAIADASKSDKVVGPPAATGEH